MASGVPQVRAAVGIPLFDSNELPLFITVVNPSASLLQGLQQPAPFPLIP